MGRPSFLGIGAQKAGTSWLHAQLVQHPEVWMPPIKEIQYFSHLFVPEHRSWTTWHISNAVDQAILNHVRNTKRLDKNYLRYLLKLAEPSQIFSEGWYLDIFDRPGSIGKEIGEITPEYSTIPGRGIRYIKNLLGNIKIIYIIRDPVQRAMSQIRMHIQRQQIVAPTEAQWMEIANGWDVRNRGDYATFLPRWLDEFGPNLLVLPFGAIATDPQYVIDRVEKHLNIPSFTGYKNLNAKVHVTESMTIPNTVIDHLKNEFAPQLKFLKDTMGADFVSRI